MTDQKHFEKKYSFKIGGKIRRQHKKKTRPNPHSIYTVKKYYHSHEMDWVVLEGKDGKEFSMYVKGLDFFENIVRRSYANKKTRN